jgi:cytosine/adenosine deaminase-related metal-dependent hydrolase
VTRAGGAAAEWIWLGPGRALRTAALRWDDRGRIVSIDAQARAPARALLPGLVNAHAHLQLAPLAPGERRFVPWLRCVIEQQRSLDAAERATNCAAAAASLLAEGTIAVGEIDSSGQSPDVLRRFPLDGRCYRELLGFDIGPARARNLVRQQVRGTRWCPPGLSPHAPYSTSPELLRAARASGRALTVHVAESEEEPRFLRSGQGPLRGLLRDLGRLPAGWRAPRRTPVEHLDRLGLLGPRTSLVHAQVVTGQDLERIRARGSPIVVCPGTIAWFRRRPPPVAEWLALGVQVGLGTDSRASNEGLSMRRELCLARRHWPRLPAGQILAMATVGGATALARPGLGRLQRGGFASFVVIDARGVQDVGQLEERFVRGELEVLETWTRGRRWLPAGGAPAPGA